jgi:hypothetical protein
MMESYTGSSGISAEQKAAMEEVLKQAQQ